MTWQPEKPNPQYPYNPSQNPWQPAPPPSTSYNYGPPPQTNPYNSGPFNAPIVVFNTRNLPYVRGESKQPGAQGNRMVMGILVAVAGIFGLFMLCVWVNDFLNDNDLKENGSTVQAFIVQRHYSTGRYGTKSFYLNYSFTLNYSNGTRKTYTHDQTVDEQTYLSHPPGATIAIRYLAANPTLSQIPSQSSTGFERFAQLGFAIFGFAVAGGVLWFIFKDIDLNHLLGEKGRPIVGVINEANIVRNRRYIKNLVVNYSFVTPFGYPVYKNYTVPLGGYQKKLQLAPGTPVGIAYVDDKHFKLM